MPRARKPKGADAESELISAILATKRFKAGEGRADLLLYLFNNRDRTLSSKEIIDKVFQVPLNLASENLVRDRLRDLREMLENFRLVTNTPLVCTLPAGTSGQGYQLEIKLRDPEAITSRFWKPHMCEGEVYTVYVEQLIFQNWPQRFSLRDPELNADSEEEALAQFNKKYSTKFGDELVVAYSYVAYGEVLARDRIARWFDDRAFIKVETAVTRTMDQAKVWNSSAILLGDPRSHSMMLNVLKDCNSLDMKMEVVKGEHGYIGRARVSNPGESDLRGTAGLDRSDSPDAYTLSYHPDSGTVLALVTRVRNRKTRKTVTIFCSEVARTTEHLAHLFTNDELLQRLINQVGWNGAIPAEFQILFSFTFGSLSTSHLMCYPEVVAWRPETA